ncbi:MULTISPECIES: YnfA family protein [Methylotenera]|uniref:YnfA family protein n=1 Tax=Methylotenera TaxID=359407 RepID=UPI0003712262
MEIFKTVGLFTVTAIAEIVGCYLPYLYLKQGGSIWLLAPAILSLGLFVWLLSLHPTAAGRVYAAYGGIYIGVAIMWLWVVDSIKPSLTDWLGAVICLIGATVIIFGAKTS